MEYWKLKKGLLNSENTEIINLFLLSLVRKKRSQQTIIRQRSILQRFFEKSNKVYNCITLEDITNWLLDQQMGCNKRTISCYLATLRIFYFFCENERFIEESPLQDEEKSVSHPSRYWELKMILPNIENQNIINEFLVNLKNSGKGKSTIICKRVFLQQFFKDFKKEFNYITITEIEDWFLKNGHLWSDKTGSGILSALRTFYDFCWETRIIENPPLRNKRKDRNLQDDEGFLIQIRLPNIENRKKINEYLLNLKHKNKSHRTIEEYRFILQAYFKDTDTHFTLLKNYDFQNWIQSYKGVKNEKTLDNYMSIFRSFYIFCVRKKYLERSPIPYKYDKLENNRYWEISNLFVNNDSRKIINEYLLSMKLENLSAGTIYQYRFFLNSFFKDKRENCLSLTPEEIRKCFIPLQKGLKAATIKTRLTILFSFYNFCVDEGYIHILPIKKRWFPRKSKSIPKFLEKEEIAKVRQLCEKRNQLRNRVMVELLLTSGCRISEINMLNKSDIDLENRTAQVLGKGKKIREVHFSETCAILLERLLESYIDEHPALFISERGTRLGIRQMQKIVEQVGIDAKIKSSLHPHRFRHTFATELLTKGADLSFIADELGHKQLQTTKIYACLPNWKLISLYRKFKG